MTPYVEAVVAAYDTVELVVAAHDELEAANDAVRRNCGGCLRPSMTC